MVAKGSVVDPPLSVFEESEEAEELSELDLFEDMFIS